MVETLLATQAGLVAALLFDGPLSQRLYQQEMAEHIDYWRQGMRCDKDNFFLAVNEREGEVALLLLDESGQQFVNEDARRELRHRWSTPGVYTNNMLLFIPDMAGQLAADTIWTMGVKVAPTPLRQRGGPLCRRR